MPKMLNPAPKKDDTDKKMNLQKKHGKKYGKFKNLVV